MKSEAEIRQHLLDLRWAHSLVSSCTTREQREQCRIGGLMMLAVITSLSWVLDERPEYTPLVAELNHQHKIDLHGTCSSAKPQTQKER